MQWEASVTPEITGKKNPTSSGGVLSLKEC